MQALGDAQAGQLVPAAVRQADTRNLPVLVYFGITESYPEANLRRYAFLVDGLADALLDRLVHNAYTLELKGGSMRKAYSTLADDNR